MKFTKIRFSFLAALLLVGVSTMSSAAQQGQGWRDAPWRFSAKVYGWLPKAPATIKIDQVEVANLPESLDNILSHRLAGLPQKWAAIWAVRPM
jgi:hypothetical protein